MDITSMDTGEPLVLPRRTLLVLCGGAGAGKSTFARSFVEEHRMQGLRDTSVVSSDYCRALVCDDDNNQQASRDAFELLYYIVHKRLLQARFTVVDSTALHVETRHRLLEIAQRHRYTTCLLIFNTSLATSIQRDRTRTRIVGEEVIRYHEGLLRQTLTDVPLEGWHQVCILAENNPICSIIISEA